MNEAGVTNARHIMTQQILSRNDGFSRVIGRMRSISLSSDSSSNLRKNGGEKLRFLKLETSEIRDF